MKRKWALIAILLVAVATVGVLVALWLNHDTTEYEPVEKFELSDERVVPGEFIELTAAEFEQMLVEKKNFVVIVHMEICPAEFPLTSVAKQLAYDEGLKIYALREDEFKETGLAKAIRYLPSAAIYREGELVAYLDAEKDSDTAYYKSAAGLKSWLGQYLEL